ncbi:MAG TPA: hypothetical protein ENO23_10190 [Alphaproteobacteria bacterium]|nr:hypothetical protein [Alphaproteobacteria bacterium]
MAVRLRLECSAVDSVEPRAARILAGSLLAWTHRGGDRSVDVLNLRLHVDRDPGSRPLRIFREPDELLFYDPDGADVSELAPSRH